MRVACRRVAMQSRQHGCSTGRPTQPGAPEAVARRRVKVMGGAGRAGAASPFATLVGAVVADPAQPPPLSGRHRPEQGSPHPSQRKFKAQARSLRARDKLVTAARAGERAAGGRCLLAALHHRPEGLELIWAKRGHGNIASNANMTNTPEKAGGTK